MVEIQTGYKEYDPPEWVIPAVRRLIHSVTNDQLSALRVIVLTNSGAVGRGRTHRIKGRKYDIDECKGFYHRRSSDGEAWIQLVIDNMIESYPALLPRFNLGRDAVIGCTLYHEIGHHLTAAIGPLKGGEEASAEAWAERLMRRHIRGRYWYYIPFIFLGARISKIVKRIRKRRDGRWRPT